LHEKKDLLSHKFLARTETVDTSNLHCTADFINSYTNCEVSLVVQMLIFVLPTKSA